MISKTAAGGLSAGIFLLWWPDHLPAAGVTWLVLRGVLWTLVFEALLISFVPLERMLCRRIRLPRLRSARARVAAAPVRVRTGVAVALAAVGVAGPLALLADGGTPPAADAAAKRPKVIRQVVVKRPVVKRRVVVNQVAAPVASASPAPEPASPATERPAHRTRDERSAQSRPVARTEPRADATPRHIDTPPEPTPAATATPEPTPDATPDAGGSAAVPAA